MGDDDDERDDERGLLRTLGEELIEDFTYQLRVTGTKAAVVLVLVAAVLYAAVTMPGQLPVVRVQERCTDRELGLESTERVATAAVPSLNVTAEYAYDCGTIATCERLVEALGIVTSGEPTGSWGGGRMRLDLPVATGSFHLQYDFEMPGRVNGALHYAVQGDTVLNISAAAEGQEAGYSTDLGAERLSLRNMRAIAAARKDMAELRRQMKGAEYGRCSGVVAEDVTFVTGLEQFMLTVFSIMEPVVILAIVVDVLLRKTVCAPGGGAAAGEPGELLLQEH